MSKPLTSKNTNFHENYLNSLQQYHYAIEMLTRIDCAVIAQRHSTLHYNHSLMKYRSEIAD